jgi:hypothetical protein
MRSRKNEQNQAMVSRFEQAAMMIFMFSSLTLGLFIMALDLAILESTVSRFIAPVIIVLSYLWLFIRHINKENWMSIETAIDESYSKRKRDTVFVVLFTVFFTVHSLALILLFL